MNPELAKQILEAWSRGALVAPGSMSEAITTLARGGPSSFVEDCIARRGISEGRRSG